MAPATGAKSPAIGTIVPSPLTMVGAKMLTIATAPQMPSTAIGWRPGTPLPAGGTALATLSTMVFAAIVLAQMANAFECRSSRLSLRTIGPTTNRLLVGAVAVEGLALLGFVYLGPIQALLGHQPLTLVQWLPVLVAPVLLFAAEEARKAVIRRHRVDRHRARGPDDPEPSDRPRLALAGEDAGPDEVRRDERQVDLPSLGGSRRWR
jgi:magnesium-transporting ATPase (P-type)